MKLKSFFLLGKTQVSLNEGGGEEEEVVLFYHIYL